ncbi:hypothetical protein O181_029491 [Austropuccinia psidii MF-1]|uniref:Uncharacterized protein n=1 Tax=Austropuccinia psidii MF-1 TaxID=1389203 RepID=A0A9Q3H3C6_9BASI|nr:hypothetical protein [Austropuccinia psidii MF-1]
MLCGASANGGLPGLQNASNYLLLVGIGSNSFSIVYLAPISYKIAQLRIQLDNISSDFSPTLHFTHKQLAS